MNVNAANFINFLNHNGASDWKPHWYIKYVRGKCQHPIISWYARLQCYAGILYGGKWNQIEMGAKHDYCGIIINVWLNI